jgi:site-specific recombinase XerD
VGSVEVAISEARNRQWEEVWNIVTSLVLDGLSSAHTRRAYSQALEEFLVWFRDEPGRTFNKAAVQKYRAELETKDLAASSINVRLSAIRRFALEAADNGLLDPEVAAGIARAKGAKRSGVRLGRWLTTDQVGQLLATPDLNTLKGLRDRALLAFLIGAGLRRSEVAALDCTHIQQRNGRWLVANLIGKHGRIRTVPLPAWAHVAMREWVSAADISEGPLFRSVTRYGHVAGRRLSAQAIFMIVTGYAASLGIAIGPHDLRRTFAKLAHLGQSPLEQIQFSLGHASVVTTEVYLGSKQDLQDAPCDHLGLTVIVTADTGSSTV